MKGWGTSNRYIENGKNVISSPKKLFRNISIIILIITIIFLFVCHNPFNIIPGYEPTWAYLKFDTDFNGTLSQPETVEIWYPQYWPDNPNKIRLNSLGDMPTHVEEAIAPIFKQYFQNPRSVQVGLSEEAFTYVPTMVQLAFLAIIIIEILIIIFEKRIDKKYYFDIKTFNAIQGILYSLMILPSVFIISLISRYPGSYILMQQHWGPPAHYIFTGEVNTITHWTYITPYILLLFTFIILIISIIVINQNIKLIIKNMKVKPIKSQQTKYRYTISGDRDYE